MDSATELTLDRLLSRLEHTLLSPAGDARLRRSKYERARVAANVEHARTLLLALDKQSSTIRVQTQKQQIQTELNRKRDAVKRLSVRLQELGDENQDSSGDEDNVTDEHENVADDKSDQDDDHHGTVMNGYGPAQQNTSAGYDIGESHSRDVEQSTELRSRKPIQAQEKASASTTAREQLFAGRKQNPDLETSEALMSHHRAEQEALSNGLLGLARALKESSLSFASSLESEKDVMKRAEGGLDKSALGMEQAERKMGMLRRMSEGQGWWGRIKLYGFIAGLWLACFLLVFVGPKLRF